MRHYDFSPLYRSFVGFDRMAALIDSASKIDSASSYPPYNIEQIDEDNYRIELAVAGFSEGELQIESNRNVLTVTGAKEASEAEKSYVHRGIAGRGFERRFQLADHVIVTGADLQNGMLIIDLVRELPEALKPRQIAIGATARTGAAANDKKLTQKKASSKGKAA